MKHPIPLALCLLLGAGGVGAQQPVASPAAPTGLKLRSGSLASAPDGVLSAGHAAWGTAPALKVVLHETPRLYRTDPKPGAAPSVAEVRAVRAPGALFVRIVWADATRDAAKLPTAGPMPRKSVYRAPTARTDRFFDAAAVMLPQAPSTDGVYPSLQMGDAKHPVRIYFWEAARGARIMEASGRATTKDTRATFPAAASYAGGRWTASLRLPATPAGAPLSFAVWDGGRQHRDGRKYFSVWYVLE